MGGELYELLLKKNCVNSGADDCCHYWIERDVANAVPGIISRPVSDSQFLLQPLGGRSGFYVFSRKWKYETFVVVQCCQRQLIQPQIGTNKHDRVTFTTSSCINFQLLLAALKRNSPWSVLLRINQMPCICAFILTLDWANLPQALIFCLTEFLVVYVWLFIGCEKVIADLQISKVQ